MNPGDCTCESGRHHDLTCGTRSFSLRAALDDAGALKVRFCASCGRHLGLGAAMYVPIDGVSTRVCVQCRRKWR